MTNSIALFVVFNSLTFTGEADFKKSVESAARRLAAAFQKQDTKYIREHTTKNHLSITTNMQRFSRSELLEAVSKTKIPPYTLSKMRIVPVTKDVVLVSYRCDFKGVFEGEKSPRRVLVISTWVKQRGKWIEASYQQTPLP